MNDVIEIWADTGETIERNFTEDELKQREEDAVAYEEQKKQQELINNLKIAAKESAIAKLAVLGLTEEEVLALLGTTGV